MAQPVSTLPLEISSQTLGIEKSHQAGGIISYEQRLLIEFVLGLIMQSFNFTALVSNSLNIAVFVKLGLAESSNVSLLALSICDLTATIMSVWNSICGVPAFKELNLPFNPDTITLYTGYGPWGFVIRCGAWITVYISFERCLCILIPLKVKRLITTKSTVIIVSSIATLTHGGMSILYILWTFKWVYSPKLNRTILDVVIVNKPGYNVVYLVAHYLFGMLSVFLAFGIVVVCTVFLVVHLKRNSQWRKSAMSGQATLSDDTGGEKMSAKKSMLTKEERLVKMVISIAAVFIVCFTPNAVYHLCIASFPEFALFGKYENLLAVMFLTTSILQSISASVNIFIYYRMGTKFRKAFREMLCLDKKMT